MPQFLSLQNEDNVSLFIGLFHGLREAMAVNVGPTVPQLILKMINSYQTLSYRGSKIRSALSDQVASSDKNSVGMI